MEFSLKTVIVLLILLIAFLIFTTIILGWGQETNTWFYDVFGGLKSVLGNN